MAILALTEKAKNKLISPHKEIFLAVTKFPIFASSPHTGEGWMALDTSLVWDNAKIPFSRVELENLVLLNGPV